MKTQESKEYLLNQFDKLSKEKQKKVINYVKWLTNTQVGKDVDNLFNLAGSVDAEELKLMEEAIKEGCEEVDYNEW